MATNIFDIVMVSWGRIDMTELAIMSINKHTFTPYRLTVIDNYSSGNMREMLIELRDGGLIDNLVLLETNIGLEPAKNLGMSFVGSDIFISTDNDCLPMKPDKDGDWLSKMVALMENNADYGAIACRTQVMVGTGNIFEDKEDQDIVDFPWPGGSLRAMRKNLVDTIGGWRNDVMSRGSEEKYICGEIHDLGYKTGFATHIKCYHMFGNGNWGYADLPPEEHGHNPVCHPAIQNGDGDEIKEYL